MRVRVCVWNNCKYLSRPFSSYSTHPATSNNNPPANGHRSSEGVVNNSRCLVRVCRGPEPPTHRPDSRGIYTIALRRSPHCRYTSRTDRLFYLLGDINFFPCPCIYTEPSTSLSLTLSLSPCFSSYCVLLILVFILYYCVGEIFFPISFLFVLHSP